MEKENTGKTITPMTANGLLMRSTAMVKKLTRNLVIIMKDTFKMI